MDSLQALVLALIQGITEFLPVSSSAHLILPAQLLDWPDQGLAFDVAVHVGTLAACLWLLRGDVASLLSGVFQALKERSWNEGARLAWALSVATLPVVVVGFTFKDWIETELRSVMVIATATLGFGILLGIADRRRGKVDAGSLGTLNGKQALLIGAAQCLALIPGTSRSGITMTAALALGLGREGSARFSFLLSLPTIAGAGLLASKDLLESPDPVAWDLIALGAGASALAAGVVIKAFLAFVARVGMMPFVIYRVALAGVLFALIAAGLA
ncbi:MAG: Undecaprenyl-diphosphatase 1 [Pseudomonadota bacterium]